MILLFNALNSYSSTFWHQKVAQKVPSDGSFREFGTQENSYTKTRRFTPQTVGVCACGTVFPRLQILTSLTKCSGFWVDTGLLHISYLRLELTIIRVLNIA